MKEQTFKLNESQIKFLERCKEYGFKTPNELVITAIQRLQSELDSLASNLSIQFWHSETSEEKLGLQRIPNTPVSNKTIIKKNITCVPNHDFHQLSA